MSKKISLGIDFSMDNTQLAIVEKDGTPESISFGTNDNYLIPTIVCYNKELKEWYCGQEAINKENDAAVDKYTRIPELINKGGDNIEEIAYEYFLYLMKIAKPFSPDKIVKKIVITVDEVTPEIIKVLKAVFEKMDYKDEDIEITSYSESFVYYVLNQNKDIWINKVLFLHLDREGFSVRKLDVIKGRQPHVADVAVEDISELITMDMVKNNPADADELLCEYMTKKLDENIVSGIYLSGEGFFEDCWNKTIAGICTNRRVFMGNNLLVKGAAYSAKEIFYNPEVGKYLISCKGRTRVRINMAVQSKDRESSITLSDIGTYWYLANSKVECIMEKPTEAVFEIQDIMNHKNETFKVDLTEFPERPPKTTRIEVNFRYLDENKIQVVIKDLGFGEFFKSSNMTVTREVML